MDRVISYQPSWRIRFVSGIQWWKFRIFSKKVQVRAGSGSQTLVPALSGVPSLFQDHCPDWKRLYLRPCWQDWEAGASARIPSGVSGFWRGPRVSFFIFNVIGWVFFWNHIFPSPLEHCFEGCFVFVQLFFSLLPADKGFLPSPIFIFIIFFFIRFCCYRPFCVFGGGGGCIFWYACRSL
jgi:hypothetical protein